MRCHVYQGNQNGEEAKNMDDQDDTFDFWQQAQHDRIHENTDEYHCPKEEGSVPSLKIIVGLVEDDQPLNDSTDEVSTGSYESLPSSHSKPA